MSAQPVFVTNPLNFGVNISAANTARDGTGTIGILATAGADKLRIDDIYMKAKVTTTAGMLRMWLHDGTNFRLLKEIIVTAITASGSVPSWESQLTGLGIVLQSGWSLRFSTDKGESFDISATSAGDFA
jgi:hypothetical protein